MLFHSVGKSRKMSHFTQLSYDSEKGLTIIKINAGPIIQRGYSH